MYKVNDNYLKLPGSYLFAAIGKKVNTYAGLHPDKKIIRLGIGDVTQPLAPAIIKALHSAVDEMADAATFKAMGRNATVVIYRNYFHWIIRSPYAIPCIRSMWIPT